ncbi:MAG: alpha/beta hydrolase [Ilumatobacteraceae bacterium]
MLDPAIRTRRCRVGEAAGAAVELDVLEAGEAGAPLVLLAHGFPEAAYSWRHQLTSIAAAGFHVIAPNQRGCATSSRPEAVTDYGITALSGDLVALIDDAGAAQATIVGHDWGALIVWEMARLHPERVNGVVGVSVPYSPLRRRRST